MQNDERIRHAWLVVVGSVRHDHAKGIDVLLQGYPYLIVLGVILSVLRLFILQSFPSAAHVPVLVSQQVSIAIHLHKVLLSVFAHANDPFARTARTACHGYCHLLLVDSVLKEVEAVSPVELA